MMHFMRRSLLVQLLSVYLLFAVVVLFANLGASAIVGLPSASLESRPISALYEALRTAAVDPAECERVLAQADSAEATYLPSRALGIALLRRKVRGPIGALLTAHNSSGLAEADLT